jgi:histidine triad (HIT) family protein
LSDPTCLFCRIVAREIPADVVLETETILAFRDIAPQAPTHVLIIPKAHVASIAEAAEDDRDVLGDVLLAARAVAEREGVAETGFRTVLNTGPHGGQEVPHLHAHVLGGRAHGWPPG